MNNITDKVVLSEGTPSFIPNTLKPVPGPTTFTKCSIVPCDRLRTFDSSG